MSFDQFVDIATIVSYLFAGVGLFYTAVQLRHTYRTTQGEFLLRLDELADRYDAVYYDLREAFDSDGQIPAKVFSEREVTRIKEYMGFLEHAEVLMQKGSIDPGVFDDLFGHRVRAVAANQQVLAATIHSRPERWRQFSRLLRRLDIQPSALAKPSDIVAEAHPERNRERSLSRGYHQDDIGS